MTDVSHAPSATPTVLLLGVAHLANNNRDYFNVQFDDMLSPRRQQEIAHCVDQLARFRPTKVAVEILTEQGRDLNEDYRHYRAGTFALTANEIHQLGFRTAAAAGHEQIHAINWNTPIDWDQAVTFAQERQPALLEEMWGPLERSTTELTRQVEHLSVSAILRSVNSPAKLAENQRTYLTKMRIGEAERYVGVDIVKEWYARNMRIFVNLTRLIDSPQDRVLVIFGAGHIPLLAQYVRDSGLYTLEQATTYLAIDTEL